MGVVEHIVGNVIFGGSEVCSAYSAIFWDIKEMIIAVVEESKYIYILGMLVIIRYTYRWMK